VSNYHAAGNQMDLEGADVLKVKPIWRAAEELALLPRWVTASGASVSGQSTTDERVAVRSA
jgi:hypothetical protein